MLQAKAEVLHPWIIILFSFCCLFLVDEFDSALEFWLILEQTIEISCEYWPSRSVFGTLSHIKKESRPFLLVLLILGCGVCVCRLFRVKTHVKFVVEIKARVPL